MKEVDNSKKNTWFTFVDSFIEFGYKLSFEAVSYSCTGEHI